MACWKRPINAAKPRKYRSRPGVTPVPGPHTKVMPNANVSSHLSLELGLPFCPAMKFVLIPALAVFTLLGQSIAPSDSSPEEARASDPNVNSRYIIESINFIDQRDYKLSTSALEDIRQLIGAKVDTEALDRLVKRIRAELRAHEVTFKLTRGEKPEEVKVLIQVDRAAGAVDASVPKLIYNSQLGFTGIGQVSHHAGLRYA